MKVVEWLVKRSYVRTNIGMLVYRSMPRRQVPESESEVQSRRPDSGNLRSETQESENLERRMEYNNGSGRVWQFEISMIV
jgi:hypothetical protein